MKRCPECDSVFPDADQFCELDGTPLVATNLAADLEDLASELTRGAMFNDRIEQSVQKVSPVASRQVAHQSEGSWKTLAIVAVAGVAIGVVLYVAYYAMTRPAPTESSNATSANSSIIQPPGPLVPSGPSPDATASASVEPSPSPSALPSPSKQTNAARIELGSGAVSTSGDEKSKPGPVIIRLTDGASIAADEAWQTGEGIWYRRGGVLTLLNPKQVKAIERVPATPAQPSPSQSPTR
jgi:hypothetical protein